MADSGYTTIEIGIPISNMPTWEIFQVCDEIETVLNRLRNYAGCNDKTRYMKFNYTVEGEATSAKNEIVKIFRAHEILIDNDISYIVIVGRNGNRISFNV
jgi:hypothetical protein